MRFKVLLVPAALLAMVPDHLLHPYRNPRLVAQDNVHSCRGLLRVINRFLEHVAAYDAGPAGVAADRWICELDGKVDRILA